MFSEIKLDNLYYKYKIFKTSKYFLLISELNTVSPIVLSILSHVPP